MDAPRLPPVVAGRSALPAFLAVEAWARERSAGAEARAAAHLAASEAEAKRLHEEGERALEQAVLDGEHEALRDVETRQRDRVSTARRAVEAWIQAAETASERAVSDALALLTGRPSSADKAASGPGSE